MAREMSAADQYEVDVAKYINLIENVKAYRPAVSVKYSDIVIEKSGKKAWLEVKMNHSDNLGNTRVSYDGEKWIAAKDGPINRFSLKLLNQSEDAHKFIDDLKYFSGMKYLKIPTTRGGLSDPYAIPLKIMKEFFKERNRYIIKVENIDMGSLVTQHYLEGKAEPAHYMSAGDDFYMIGKENPLELSTTIPTLCGYGTFKMRISTRSKFYEVQPEIKIDKMPDSLFSTKPNSVKLNPFII